jgi:hypothetical protein
MDAKWAECYDYMSIEDFNIEIDATDSKRINVTMTVPAPVNNVDMECRLDKPEEPDKHSRPCHAEDFEEQVQCPDFIMTDEGCYHGFWCSENKTTMCEIGGDDA